MRSTIISEFFTQAIVGVQGGHCHPGPSRAEPWREREGSALTSEAKLSEQNALGKAMQSGEYSKGKNQKILPSAEEKIDRYFIAGLINRGFPVNRLARNESADFLWENLQY